MAGAKASSARRAAGEKLSGPADWRCNLMMLAIDGICMVASKSKESFVRACKVSRIWTLVQLSSVRVRYGRPARTGRTRARGWRLSPHPARRAPGLVRGRGAAGDLASAGRHRAATLGSVPGHRSPAFARLWAELHAAGWDGLDLFGLHAAAPAANPPGWGLAWLLGTAGEVLDVSPAALGMTREAGGARLTLYKRQAPARAGILPAWNLPGVSA